MVLCTFICKCAGLFTATEDLTSEVFPLYCVSFGTCDWPLAARVHNSISLKCRHSSLTSTDAATVQVS